MAETVKRAWKIRFKDGRTCTMILPDPLDEAGALGVARRQFLGDRVKCVY